jgi:hypothetical protein
MRLGTCERTGCTAPATTQRVLRFGEREWTIRLCRHHVVILSLMITGWVREVPQNQPTTPPRLSPVGPPAESPAAVLDFTRPDPEVPQRKRGALPPASPRARSRLRVVSEENVQDGS